MPSASTRRYFSRNAPRILAATSILLLLMLAGTGVAQIVEPHAALSRVETFPDLGGEHVLTTVPYGNRFSTSGPHNPRVAPPWFHDQEITPEFLVHSLEHGSVVIYRDEPGRPVLDILRRWSEPCEVEAWSGIVVVCADCLGERKVLTACTKKSSSFERFNDMGRLYVDALRGRGPQTSLVNITMRL